MVSTPGSEFLYNSAAVHLLGVLLEETVARPLPEYADEHLFGPLGIGVRRWEAMPGDRVNGGAGIDLRPRDLARLGQLFLQEGVSGDRQIIPASWVSLATAPAFTWSSQSGPIDDLSYGYLWWVDRTRNAYFAWGYGGQFVYVVPDRDLVVVTTTQWRLLSQDGGPGPLTDAVLEIIVNGIVPAVPLR
jgi:CubicO group peptidase (beta-lactamase class C family)